MAVRNQELYKIIETLPEELLNKVLEYIDFLKYIEITSKVPEDIVIKDKKDLRKKIEEGIEDTERGNVCSIDEAFADIETGLAEEV